MPSDSKQAVESQLGPRGYRTPAEISKAAFDICWPSSQARKVAGLLWEEELAYRKQHNITK